MQDFLSLHDAEQIAADAAPAHGPSFGRVVTGILTHPAETFREALAHPVQSHALTLAALGGVYWALNLSIAQGLGASLALPLLLPAALAVGLSGGIVYMYALSILIHWACDILEIGRAHV